MRQAAFLHGRDDLRADQDGSFPLVPGDLAGEFEQGRHLGHGVAAADGLRQLQTAWSWLHKIRRAMVAPGRAPLAGRVEADETYLGAAKPGAAAAALPARSRWRVPSRAAAARPEAGGSAGCAWLP